MKRIGFVPVIFLFLSLAGCHEKTANITNLSMLEGGKTFAVPTGTAADQFVLKKFPDAKIMYFNTVLDCAIAVKTDKADAAVYDKPILQNIAAKNEGLVVLSELLFGDQYGFAVQLENTELKMAMDDVLAELQSNGIYDDMMRRWFPAHGNPAPMPELNWDGEDGILRFGTAAVTEPMSFYDADHRIVGFDIEFASRIAMKLNRRLEILDMEFGAMLPALIAGKVDMIGAGLSITEERARKVLFSRSYYPSGIAAVVRSAVEEGKDSRGKGYTTIEDVRDKRIAVLLGSIHDAYVMKTYPEAELLEYQNATDILTALKTDKADAGFYDHISLSEVFVENPDMGILAQDVFFADIAAGFNEENDALREQFNAFLKTIASNGVYDDMVDRWIQKGVKQMPDIGLPSPSGSLRFGVVGDLGMPFSLYREGELTGFDVELGKRFAASLGKEYVPMDMPFSSLIAAASTGKIDLITASMMITEEREKRIDFSDPYYRSGATLIALKKNLAAYRHEDTGKARKSFFAKITESFHDNILLEKRYVLILDGLRTTVVISIFSAILGTLLGGLICFMRMSKRKILSGTAGLLITLIRGTPVLVLLMIIFYIIFASVNINPVVVAVIAFAINFGAYVSEMFRTSIQGVDKGQHEAGIASGFTRMQTFIHIIMPQAMRQVLPVYKGEFISLVKMTSIVGYVAVQDLTKASDIIRSRTFDAFFPLIMAAVIYLLIAWLLTWALSRIEISVDPKRRRSRREMEVRI